ncbi:MAG: translation initiation factor IF-2, partial [Candidatus Bathyarchaeota archaeon]|nr:translation initiation factor IF-2 [Candidatus Bathyarchaeota archaeon]
PRAEEGWEVAVSMPRPVVGRHIKERDVLFVDIPEEHARKLRERFTSRLTEAALEALGELVEIKRERDPLWAI